MSRFLRLQPLWWTLAALAFALLCIRGYHNAHLGFRGDDSQFYLGSQQLFKTGSFYRNLDYATIAGPHDKVWPQEHNIPNAYPPALAVFYLPFALLPWSIAHNLWLVLNMVCLVVLGLVLFRQFGDRLPREALPIWLFALFISFPPYDVSYMGQTSFPIVLGLALGWRYATRTDKAAVWLSALFYSIAMLKTTVALPFLLYQLCRTESRRAALAAIALTITLTLSVMLYSGHPFAMLSEYRTTITALFQVGAPNDTAYGHSPRLTTASVLYFTLIRKINGHTFRPETPQELAFVRVFEWLICLTGAVFFLSYARFVNRLRAQSAEADTDKLASIRVLDDWAFATLNVFSIVVIYHNWYDLGQLFIPFIIVLNAFADGDVSRRRPRLAALGTLILLLYFMVRTQIVHRVATLIHMTDTTMYVYMSQTARVLLIVLTLQLVAEMRAAQRASTPPATEPFQV